MPPVSNQDRSASILSWSKQRDYFGERLLARFEPVDCRIIGSEPRLLLVDESARLFLDQRYRLCQIKNRLAAQR